MEYKKKENLSIKTQIIKINEGNEEKIKENKEEKINYYRLKRTYNESIEIIDKIFKKGIRNRTHKDICELNEFLNMINYEYNMKEEIEEEHLDLNQLIFFSTQFMIFKQFNKGDIIYHEGDRAENFYVLIKGNVNLFKLTFEIKLMNAFEYYNYLKYYHDNIKDSFVLNKTVKVNKKIFPICLLSDIPNFNEILFKVKLLQLIYNGVNKHIILNHIRNNYKNPDDYFFYELDTEEIKMDDYFLKIESKLTESELFYYKSITNEIKKVKIMENILNKSLTEKEYFGLFKLKEGGNIRKNSAIIESDNTLLLVINKKLYSGCISKENRTIKENEVDKIYFGIFTSIRRLNFEKYYFYNFDKVEYFKGENLFCEGDKIDNIYILKKGFVEINLLNKTILDIKKLINKFKEFDKSFLNEEFDDTLKLKNSLHILQRYINQRNNYSLFVINTREIFGIWEYRFNKRKTCYNIKIKSDKAIFYKMNIDIFLNEINGKIPDSELLRYQIKIDAYEQVKNYIQRLIYLKNSVLMKIDFDFTKMKKEEEKQYNFDYNIFENKHLLKPLNYISNIKINFKNNLLKPQHKKVHSFDYQNLKITKRENNSLRKIILHKPINSLSSDKSYDKIESYNEKNSRNISLLNIENYNTKNNSNFGRNINCLFKNYVFNTRNYINSPKKIYFPKIITINRIESPINIRKKNKSIKKKFFKKTKNTTKNNISINDSRENNNDNIFDYVNFNLKNKKSPNYLAIREFYNKIKGIGVKKILNKTMQ